jgi:pyruvate carboxylase
MIACNLDGRRLLKEDPFWARLRQVSSNAPAFVLQSLPPAAD